MEKIRSGEMHRTPGGKTGYQRQIFKVVQGVREEIGESIGSRKPGLFASGAIHALRLLVESSNQLRLHVCKAEVEYWRETFFDWFKRVKRYFPEEHREQFQLNAEEDFEIILQHAPKFVPSQWKFEKDKVNWRVEFRDKNALRAAQDAAKEKYPVRLGIALDKYLHACIDRLVSESDDAEPLVVQVPTEPPEDRPGTVAPRLVCFDDGVHSLLVTKFGGFGDATITAYQLERAVKSLLQSIDSDVLRDLSFDCESSMFCVRSEDLQALGKVSEAIYRLAADESVFKEHFATKKTRATKKKAIKKRAKRKK